MELLKRLEGMSPSRLKLLALELDAKVQSLENARNEPIAIVGVGCRIPGGCNTPAEYWKLLDQGRDAVSEVPPDRWNIEEYFDPDPDAAGRMSSRWGGFLNSVDTFDAAFFGISRREAVSIDPQQRILLEVCWEALENAGQSPHKLHGSQTGVYVGISTGDYHHLLLDRGHEAIDAYLATGSAHSVAAGRVAYVLGLQGPNFPVDTACSSSLVAVHLAVQGLRNRECHLALAGGVNVLLSPEISIALSQSHMFASDGRCKAFDAAADGFVRAEGCGVIVLKRLSDALAGGDNILALIRGSAINQDGRSSGISAPNGVAQEAVIRQALANASIDPSQIDYVEAHGTGTSLGDPIEAHALAGVFGSGRTVSRPLVVGSVKTNLGHLESAAGIAGLIKVILAMQHGRIPPHLHFRQMNSHIDWRGLPVEIPVQGKEWKRDTKPRLAGVSSFGFSGTNAHIVLEEAPALVSDKPAAPDRSVHVLALSARSEAALDALARQFAEHVAASTSEPGDICYTANTGRAHLPERAVYIAATREELQSKLREGARLRGRSDNAPDVAFLFTGQGAQYGGMGRELYETEPVFRSAIDACAAAVREELNPGLVELLYGGATDLLNDTRYTQPAGFALQVALARLWSSWGVEPAFVLGHSVGEYAAACVAGMYSLEDGMRLITARGRLTGGLDQGGAMAAILAPEKLIREAVARFPLRVSIAAHNGPENLVISGRAQEVDLISQEFLAQGFQVERLRVSHGFHSPLMEQVAAEFGHQIAARVAFAEPRVLLISTVTGAAVALETAGTGDYWRRQVRDTVQFHQAMQTTAARGCGVFVEIGPGSTLLGMGQEIIGRDGQLWTPSIRRSKRDNEQMAETLAELYLRGVPVNWDAYESERGRRRVTLPTYPFERQRYWLDARTGKTSRGKNKRHPLLGERADSAIPVYEGALDLESAAWIADHRVAGSAVVPAAAYLEIALAAARENLRSNRAAIVDLELKEPLRIGDTDNPAYQSDAHGAVQLQTAVIPEGPGEASFRIFSRADTAGSQWTLHATGHLARARELERSVSLPILQKTIAHELPAASFYEALRARHIDLGSASRNVRRIWVAGQEALCEIRLEGEDNSAALLDSCFQAAGAAALFGLRAPSEQTCVLQKIERFEQLKPLGGTLFAHAQIQAVEHQSMTAAMTVFDTSGQLVAAASGIRLLPITIAEIAPRDWFYRLEWQEQPLVEPTASGVAAIISDADAIASWNARAAELAVANGLDAYDALRPSLDRLCAAYIVSALHHAGISFEPGARIDPAQIGVIDKHRRLWQRMLAILAEDGLLRLCGEHWEIVHRPAMADPDTACVQLEREFPQFGAELTLVRRCGVHLLEVLRGEMDPLQLLAPGGSFEALERLYVHSPAAKVFNPSAREAIESALEKAPKDRTIRILEVGAGTGGTTTYLAPALLGRNVEYVYTDVSPLFAARAQETFRDYPFFRYATLDIEQPAESQGFAREQFDVVIAANVLHATADLRRTVQNVTNLLRPSGLLLLVEGTAAERWVDLTFGMTEGWWKFEDRDLRPNHALLTRAEWQSLLASQGYTAVLVEPFAHSQQVLLLAMRSERARESRCITVSQPADLAAGFNCDALLFDATGKVTPWDFLATLRAAAARPTPPRVWLLTSGAQPLMPDDKLSPHAAAFWGIARTAALEYPQFWGGIIDIEPGMDGARIVIAEMNSASPEDQVAYRNGRRFVPRIVRQERIRSSIPGFDPNGAYLVTGGLGNLGLETARWLVRHGARRLVLTGRTAAREQKPDAIAALEKAGADVRIVAADISHDDGIACIRDAVGDVDLRGIIHAAAVFDSTPIGELSRETWEAVLRPKAGGAEKLFALAGRGLDFLVLFSSTTGLLGVRGMAAYAAANSYLDCVAHQARQTGVPAVSVNWGTWELMRGTSEEDRQSYLRSGLHPLPPAQALNALGEILGSGATQAIVASIDWDVLKAVYQSRRRRPIFDAVSGRSGITQGPRTQEQSQDLLALLADVPPSDQLGTTVSVVRREAAAVLALKPAEVDTALGLFEMGMDSLMSVELKRRLEKCCGKPLPSTLTFNYPNVSALAAYLLELLAPGLAPSPQTPVEPSKRPDAREELSEDELAGLLKQALDSVA
jgi:acyl transferase domain-containing protein/acyl carrier protein